MERLNASFHDTSFQESSITSGTRTLASEAITLAIESKTLTTECTRTLTRSDSGIGVSPQPICSHSENQPYCSQPIYSHDEKTYTHNESLPIYTHSETQDIYSKHRDVCIEENLHSYIHSNIVSADKSVHTTSGKIRPDDPEYEKDVLNLYPPAKRFRRDEAQV